MAVAVTSEVGRLRRVLVHSPGAELLAVTPQTRATYLYDDIVDPIGALAEHRQFVAVLQRCCEVLSTTALLTEALSTAAARHFLMARSEEVTADHDLRGQLDGLSVEGLITAFVQGWQPDPGPFCAALGQLGYAMPPIPNLLYARDAAMVVGGRILVGAMHHPARWPEEVLLRTLVGHHPALADGSLLYDGSDERRAGFSLEGGDVHPLRQDLVLIGISERSSAPAVDQVTELLLRDGAVTDVVAVVLPVGAHAIHLDMVFTQVDRGLCVAFAPLFRGLLRAPLLHRRRGEATVRQPDDLFALLRGLGLPLTPIWCGGGDPVHQLREQWASGCNHLAVGPGQVIAYARNAETLRAMEAAGLPVISAEAFLSDPPARSPRARFVVGLHGGELVRGGGGPRCMSCPLWREELT